MSLIRACCSRVTHPSAGRRQVLLLPLPRDLHVLSLPLAFILSQDQTLLCIFFKFLARPDALNSLKKSTLSIHFVLGTCLYLSLNIFNELCLFQTLSRKILRDALSRPPVWIFKELLLSGLPLEKRVAKVETFSKLAKFYFNFFYKFLFS